MDAIPPQTTHAHGDVVLHTWQPPGGTRQPGAYRGFLWLLITPQPGTPGQALLASQCQQHQLPSTHLENHLEQPEGWQGSFRPQECRDRELSAAAVPVLAWWCLLLGTTS